MTALPPGATDCRETRPQRVYINGVTFDVIDEHDGQIQVCRPNGIKLYWAVRLPDSPLYGESRARFVRQAGGRS